MLSSGEVYYYHYDGLGSVAALTDVNGTFVEYYEYNVFGEPTIWDVNAMEIVDSSVVGNPYMFTGREYDSDTGLYYYRARYYNPSIGRFLQTDPIGYAGGLNLYTYIGNNPLNWIDPWGLKVGDKYPNQDSAGCDAISDINPTSIKEDREYGGWIYKNKDGTYSYAFPKPGSQHGLTMPPKPSDATGDYHTHGAESGPDWLDEDFSPLDKEGNRADKVNGYLGTPSGRILKYDPKTGKVSELPKEQPGPIKKGS